MSEPVQADLAECRSRFALSLSLSLSYHHALDSARAPMRFSQSSVRDEHELAKQSNIEARSTSRTHHQSYREIVFASECRAYRLLIRERWTIPYKPCLPTSTPPPLAKFGALDRVEGLSVHSTSVGRVSGHNVLSPLSLCETPSLDNANLDRCAPRPLRMIGFHEREVACRTISTLVSCE